MTSVREVRVPISSRSRRAFAGIAAHNPALWPGLFAQALVSASAVWGRDNQSKANILALIRTDIVRSDHRVLFRFLDAASSADLFLSGITIEHGDERVRTPMVLTATPLMVAAKGIYTTHGETRLHYSLAVSPLKGVMPQARVLVIKLELPAGVEKPVFGSVEPVTAFPDGDLRQVPATVNEPEGLPVNVVHGGVGRSGAERVPRRRSEQVYGPDDGVDRHKFYGPDARGGNRLYR